MKRWIVGFGAAAMLGLVGCQTEDTLYNQQGPAAPPELEQERGDAEGAQTDRIGGAFGGGAETGGEYETTGEGQSGLIMQDEEELPVPETEERVDPKKAAPEAEH